MLSFFGEVASDFCDRLSSVPLDAAALRIDLKPVFFSSPLLTRCFDRLLLVDVLRRIVRSSSVLLVTAEEDDAPAANNKLTFSSSCCFDRRVVGLAFKLSELLAVETLAACVPFRPFLLDVLMFNCSSVCRRSKNGSRGVISGRSSSPSSVCWRSLRRMSKRQLLSLTPGGDGAEATSPPPKASGAS